MVREASVRTTLQNCFAFIEECHQPPLKSLLVCLTLLVIFVQGGTQRTHGSKVRNGSGVNDVLEIRDWYRIHGGSEDGRILFESKTTINDLIFSEGSFHFSF